MIKNYLYIILFSVVFIFQVKAQNPNFPVKADLATTLTGTKVFSNGSAIDTIAIPYTNKDEFTLEVKAQINSAVGRGLDVEFSNDLGLGLRTSIDKTSFNNTTSLSLTKNISTSVDNSQEQTYRYSIKDGVAHIYQDGHYLASEKLTFLDGTIPSIVQSYGADNFLGAWAGYPSNNSGKPSDYNWSNTFSNTIFNIANGSGGVRYVDITSGHTFEDNGSTYQGRLMYIRWDGNDIASSTYSYPIELEYGYQYNFSWIYDLIANASPGAKISVAISANADGSGAIASETFTSGNAFKLKRGNFSFTSLSKGKYYLTIKGDWALFGIGDLKLSSSNLINNWDGLANDNSNTPAIYGWSNTYNSLPWQTANSASGVRYVDVTSGHSYESNGTQYIGRLMYLGWNDLAYQNSTYSFPVSLIGGKNYKFSWIYELLSGISGDKITVSLSTSQNGTAPIATKVFTTGSANSLREGELQFKPTSDGTYYITLTGDAAQFAIGKLGVKEIVLSNIVIGKNYTNGVVDMVVNSVTYEDKAYSPVKIVAPSVVPFETTSLLHVEAFAKSKVVLNASASLYLNNAYNPIINSTVDINSSDARLYFENIKPTEVINSFLSLIKVGGVQAINNVNVYVSTYGSGTVVYPHSSTYSPLEVFTEENFGGTSQQYQIVTPYTSLGSFDNNIKSFKLKKGYMATFASNSNGTGYSRVYMAVDQDLEITVLPPYLNGTISFIRTMRWNDVTKKGWCGSGTATIETNATNSTWRYNWDTGGATTPNIEYVPMRHNLYWPSFDPANNNAGYTHFLGYNEPDRPDQANISVQQAIDGWPDYMQSGLRLGSPATSDPFNPWLASFMTQAETLNYRVDYMALHCYWYKSAAQWASDLANIYNKYKRPIWITEWNIGANWTGNSFPDDPNMLTDANAMKHKNDLAAVLNVLDNADYVERYSIYNWVQDARAMTVTIDDAFKGRNPNYANYEWLKTAPVISTSGNSYMVLTPAGEYYANNASKKAYNSSKEYISTWKPLKETLSYELSSDYKNITIHWKGINNDLVNKYVIERRLEGETTFSVFYESTDYLVKSVDDVVHSRAEYRMKVIGKDNVESAYSAIIVFQQSVIPVAPTNLAGETLSSSIINLTWDAVSNAEGYNLKRSGTIDGTYDIIGSNLKVTSYQDTGLNIDTNYYYKVSALNSGGESTDSSPLTAKTFAIDKPSSVTNILMGSGDAQVKFKWDTMYDAQFYIKRSASEFGTFVTIATIDTNEYTDLTVVNGTTYYYKISAFNSAGESPDSQVLISKPNLGQHLYYNFNENGSVNPHDQWGNYAGTLMGTTTWGTGKEGSGIYLNGASSSYMDIEDGVMEGLTKFTISTWLKLETSQNWARIFDFGTDTNKYMFLTPQNGANGKFRFAFKNGGAEEQINCQISPTINTWVHVAVTLDGALGIMYINGVEVGRNNAMTINPSILGRTTLNYIGKSQWPDPYLNGTIDEFRIYNRALSATEIANLMNATLGINDRLLPTNSKYIFYTEDNTIKVNYNGVEHANYGVYSITGQLLSTGQLFSNGVTNIGAYKTGIYIVKVIDGEGMDVGKVLVK